MKVEAETNTEINTETTTETEVATKISLQEFAQAVLEDEASTPFSGLTFEQLKAYLQEPESQEVIKAEYQKFVEGGYQKLEYHVGTASYLLMLLW